MARAGLALALLSTLMRDGAVGAECFDYGSTPHWVGGVDTRAAWDVSVTGNYACIARWDSFLVVDVTSPGNPQIVGRLATTAMILDVASTATHAYVAGSQANVLRVIDITNPANPQLGASMSMQCSDLAISGSYLYVSGSSLKVVEITNPASPTLVATLATPSGGVAISGSRLYTATSGLLKVVDISNPASPQVVGSVAVPGGEDGVAVSGTRAYVTGRWDSWTPFVQAIDITDPLNPQLRGNVTAGWDGSEINGIAASGNSAFLSTWDSWWEAFGFLKVIDATDLDNPRIASSVAIPEDPRGLTVSGSCVYVAAGSGGLQVVDVSQSQNPAVVGSLVMPLRPVSVAVSGSHAYIAGYSSNLQIVDITNPQNPGILASLNTPGLTYSAAVSDQHAYLADGSALRVVDITNASSPQLVGSVSTTCRDVAFSSPYAYIASGATGLRVVDVSNPVAPQIVATADTPGSAAAVAIANGRAYVADWNSGLAVIDITNPLSPQVLGSAPTTGYANDVAVWGSHAFVVSDRFIVFDITNAQGPQPIASLELPFSYSYTVTLSRTYAYVAGCGIVVIDIRNPENPRLIGSANHPGSPVSVAVSGGYLYVADGNFPDQSGSLVGRFDILPEHCAATSVFPEIEGTPWPARLLDPYPNPARQRDIVIPFWLGQSGSARLTVHDVAGHEVARIHEGTLPAGAGRGIWTGEDARGTKLAAGVYLVRLVTEHGEQSRKIVLVE